MTEPSKTTREKDEARENGDAPFPTPGKVTDAPKDDDEQTSTPDNSFERGLNKDGRYRDAVDEMKKTIKDDGSLEEWKKGRTQN